MRHGGADGGRRRWRRTGNRRRGGVGADARGVAGAVRRRVRQRGEGAPGGGPDGDVVGAGWADQGRSGAVVGRWVRVDGAGGGFAAAGVRERRLFVSGFVVARAWRWLMVKRGNSQWCGGVARWVVCRRDGGRHVRGSGAGADDVHFRGFLRCRSWCRVGSCPAGVGDCRVVVLGCRLDGCCG